MMDLHDFLQDSAWASWHVAPMAGDASGRRFHRLTGPDFPQDPDQSAILMQADPDVAGGHEPFLRCAAHLTSHGLAAPAILKADGALALVADLGPETFAQWITHSPADETPLYEAAVDVLVALQDVPAPAGLKTIDAQEGAVMIAPLFDFYATAGSDNEKQALMQALETALAQHAPVARTFALRDFHAENLIWRQREQGLARVGLIDFQDAVVAPAVYDLISLLRDARRDVSPALYDAMVARFAVATGADPDAILTACAVVAVQRNLRILGIFARLAQRDGKARYLDNIPRVVAMIEADLSHAALHDLRLAARPFLREDVL